MTLEFMFNIKKKLSYTTIEDALKQLLTFIK